MLPLAAAGGGGGGGLGVWRLGHVGGRQALPLPPRRAHPSLHTWDTHIQHPSSHTRQQRQQHGPEPACAPSCLPHPPLSSTGRRAGIGWAPPGSRPAAPPAAWPASDRPAPTPSSAPAATNHAISQQLVCCLPASDGRRPWEGGREGPSLPSWRRAAAGRRAGRRRRRRTRAGPGSPCYGEEPGRPGCSERRRRRGHCCCCWWWRRPAVEPGPGRAAAAAAAAGPPPCPHVHDHRQLLLRHP